MGMALINVFKKLFNFTKTIHLFNISFFSDIIHTYDRI